MMTADQKWKTTAEIHNAFREKRLTVAALVQSYLDASRSNSLGAYLTLCEDSALVSAQKADEAWKREGESLLQRQPLFGIPIAVKDILVTKGVRTTCGSRILENYIPPYTATALEKLEQAGAIFLGKTNLDEFAMGSSNENSAFGSVQHPTHPDRVPGGSSGGSAAVVAAGQCFAALGTDTGGSVRLPAHYCGIVGLKPSYGRISRFGQVAFGSSLDQIGPLTQTVEDASLLLDVMSGSDPRDPSTASLPSTQIYRGLREKFQNLSQSDYRVEGLRIGIPQEYLNDGVQSEVAAAFQGVIHALRDRGAKIVSLSLPHIEYSVAVYYLLAVSEAASNLSRYDGIRFGSRPFRGGLTSERESLSDFYKKNRALFGSEVKRRIILGTFALSSGYQDDYFLKACQVRRKIQQDFLQAFVKVDVLLGPVSPTTAFLRQEKMNDPLKMYLNDIFTVPVNLGGFPAMSVPVGLDHQRLPIGIHVIAPRFQEKNLLEVGMGIELLTKGAS